RWDARLMRARCRPHTGSVQATWSPFAPRKDAPFRGAKSDPHTRARARTPTCSQFGRLSLESLDKVAVILSLHLRQGGLGYGRAVAGNPIRRWREQRAALASVARASARPARTGSAPAGC